MNKVIVLETWSDTFCGLVAFTLYSQICEWECGLYFFIFKSSVALLKKTVLFCFVLFSLGLLPSTQDISHFSQSTTCFTSLRFTLFSLAFQGGKGSVLDFVNDFCTCQSKMLHNKDKGEWLVFDFFVASQHALPFLFPWIQRHEKCRNWEQQAESQPHCFRSCSKVCLVIISFSAVLTNSNVFLILNHKNDLFPVLPILFLESLKFHEFHEAFVRNKTSQSTREWTMRWMCEYFLEIQDHWPCNKRMCCTSLFILPYLLRALAVFVWLDNSFSGFSKSFCKLKERERELVGFLFCFSLFDL